MPTVDEFVRRLTEASAYGKILFRDALVIVAVLGVIQILLPLRVSFYVDLYILIGLVLLMGLPTLLSFASSLLTTGSEVPILGRPLSGAEMVAARVAIASVAGLLLWLSVGLCAVVFTLQLLATLQAIPCD